MKLLILGATSAQIPFISKAKELGCTVAVVDYNNNAAAIKYADKYYECSILDVDGIRNICDEYIPDGITCGASDVGVVTAAIICNERNLPSMNVETALKVKDKYKMIEAFRKFGVFHPEYVVFNRGDLEKIDSIPLTFPIISKPIDKSGSKGINVSHNIEELEKAIKDTFNSTDDDNILLEEYMTGPEVSVEILVQDGEPYILQVTDKITTGAPHFIEIGHSEPSQLPDDDVKKIKRLAYNAVKAVGLDNGCGHAEIILTADGPKMVEIAGRLGGDFITTVLVPTSTGINMAEYEILRSIGTPKKFEKPVYETKSVAVRFIQTPNGKIESLSFALETEDLKNIIGLELNYDSETVYQVASSNSDRIGYVIATGDTTNEALEKCNQVINKVRVKIQK